MRPTLRRPVVLPPCGIFIGTGIMNSVPDQMVCSGRFFTVWCPQKFSPLELLDKVIEDNQGNLVQYWGFDGSGSCVTYARHRALEDLGMTPPEPDWENRKFLKVTDWIDPQEYKHRSGAGVVKLIEAAAKKGIWIAQIYTQAREEYSQQFSDAGGEYHLGYDFGEKFTFRFEEEYMPSEGDQPITLTRIADDLMQRVAEHVQSRKAAGWGNVMATSCNFYLDYEIAAGADIPMAEDFAFKQLNLSSALSRGLTRQHGLPYWGAHVAHEHYSWIPYSSPHKFPLLRLAFYLKYLSGAKMIINESGGWYLEAALVSDSPMYQTTRAELGSYRNRDPQDYAHLVADARKTYHHIDYDSPASRSYRKEISDFYDFVKTNGTPGGQPETTIAVIKGNLDLGPEEHQPNAVVAGVFSLAERNPQWFSGQPERSWDIVSRVFFPRPQVLAPWHNLFLSGTPHGQVDVTSFAADQIDGDFLSRQYKALMFAGWNSASDKQYAMLCRYVEGGGTLFLSLPHLSTNVTRNYSSFGVEELINQGDFSRLCGLRVVGKGRRIYWASAPDRNGELGFEFPRRFGILSVCLGDIEIIDPAMEVLAVDDEQMRPVLLRRKYGNGTVYFLNTWAYPGATDADYGPGAELESPGLAGYVYRHIAKLNRGTFWITDEDGTRGENCNHISWSYFPGSGHLCFQNIDLTHPRHFVLHHENGNKVIPLEPGAFSLRTAGDIFPALSQP